MVDAGRRAEKDGQAVIEVDTEKLKRFLERVPPLPSAAHDISILVDGPSPDLDKLAEIMYSQASKEAGGPQGDAGGGSDTAGSEGGGDDEDGLRECGRLLHGTAPD